jgi:VWFA-related protein
MRFFTSDPFAISAALLIDVGMPDIALEKIRQTFPAWVGAFSAYDELSVYTFGNTVKLQQDFVGAQSDKVLTAFKHASEIRGRNAGPMISDSPMTAGPSVNGRPADPATPNPITRSRLNDEPSRVLNDAVLRAAIDLSHRDRQRRKIIFIVSDGREQGSIASYSDVLKVLLSNEVAVYSIAIDASAIPGYNKLGRIRFPRQGTGNILPKYSAATGGEVYSEFNQDSIERAYAQVTEQARNQYTIGYSSPASAAGTYRSIEVRVNQTGLKIYARDGYYPLPPSRNK